MHDAAHLIKDCANCRESVMQSLHHVSDAKRVLHRGGDAKNGDASQVINPCQYVVSLMQNCDASDAKSLCITIPPYYIGGM